MCRECYNPFLVFTSEVWPTSNQLSSLSLNFMISHEIISGALRQLQKGAESKGQQDCGAGQR